LSHRKCPECKEFTFDENGVCHFFKCKLNPINQTSKIGVPVARRFQGTSPGFEAVKPPRVAQTSHSTVMRAVNPGTMQMPPVPNLTDVEPPAEEQPPTVRTGPVFTPPPAAPDNADESQPPSRRVTVAADPVPDRFATTQPAPAPLSSGPYAPGEPTEPDGLRERLTEIAPVSEEDDDLPAWQKEVTPTETRLAMTEKPFAEHTDGTVTKRPRSQSYPSPRKPSGLRLKEGVEPLAENSKEGNGPKK
jgi:hypothetical protein